MKRYHPGPEAFAELARQHSLVPDDRQLPDLSFAFYDRMVIFDHINKTVAAVAHAHVDPRDPLASYRAACQRVDRLVERLQQGVADLQLTDIEWLGEPTLHYESN